MTSMAVSAPWYYKLEKHKLWYGSVMFLAGIAIVGLAGHDMVILRNIAAGNYDINATKDLYLGIADYPTVSIIGYSGDSLTVVSIAYMAVVAIAHRKIAKDNFPLA